MKGNIVDDSAIPELQDECTHQKTPSYEDNLFIRDAAIHAPFADAVIFVSSDEELATLAYNYAEALLAEIKEREG